MRVSKRLREEAIETAEWLSAWWQPWCDSGPPIEFDGHAYWLVLKATEEVRSANASLQTWTCYLEAAALLRDGWNPGDPVVRL